MPVTCPIDVPRLGSDEFGAVDYDVMGLAFELHNELGCRWDEVVYQGRLATRLRTRFDAIHSEVPIEVTFGEFAMTYRIDLVVDRLGIYELKTVASITDAHVGQVLNYLRLLNATRAKIINFRPFSVESKFVNCSDTLAERRAFAIDSGEYTGPTGFREVGVAMFRDLGTGLSVSLYNHCLLANVGRIRRRSIGDDDAARHDFQMLRENEGNSFLCTALMTKVCLHREHLRKMLKASGLGALHWINVTPSIVRLETIRPG